MKSFARYDTSCPKRSSVGQRRYCDALRDRHGSARAAFRAVCRCVYQRPNAVHASTSSARTGFVRLTHTVRPERSASEVEGRTTMVTAGLEETNRGRHTIAIPGVTLIEILYLSKNVQEGFCVTASHPAPPTLRQLARSVDTLPTLIPRAEFHRERWREILPAFRL